jgi:dienelactone hydrolase
MKKNVSGWWSSLTLLVMVPALFAEPSKPEQSDAFTARAKASVALLAKEDFSGFVTTCDSTMQAALPTEKLQAIWQALIGQMGVFKESDGVTIEERPQYDVATVTCQFDHGPLDIQLAYNKNGKISGLHFLQSDQSAEYKTPDYAQPDSFHEHEVSVGTGAWALPGTVTLPNGKGPFPAVVLIHGSGPQDRDETIGPNKPFRDLAWGLASRGIASLRYEKRTKEYGDKLAPLKDSITIKEEVLDDARVAVACLRNQPDIDPKRIFLLGHSLGGMLIPKIGKSEPGLAGFIIMAGSTRPLEDLVLEQVSYIFSLDSISADEQEQIAELKKQVARVKDPKLSPAVPATDLPLGLPAAYWLSLRGYNPGKMARGLKQPMLILQGGRDYQVTSADFDNWKKPLSGRSNVTFRFYLKLNHLFIEGKGKITPTEYLIPGHVALEVINDIVDWIKKQ